MAVESDFAGILQSHSYPEHVHLRTNVTSTTRRSPLQDRPGDILNPRPSSSAGWLGLGERSVSLGLTDFVEVPLVWWET